MRYISSTVLAAEEFVKSRDPVPIWLPLGSKIIGAILKDRDLHVFYECDSESPSQERKFCLSHKGSELGRGYRYIAPVVVVPAGGAAWPPIWLYEEVVSY